VSPLDERVNDPLVAFILTPPELLVNDTEFAPLIFTAVDAINEALALTACIITPLFADTLTISLVARS